MTTTTNESRLVALAHIVSLVLLLGSGCGKTAPTEPALMPTPTPPVEGLAGDWSGTMSSCGPITASVAQNGSTVSIAFTSSCYGTRLKFVGALSGSALSGRMTKDGSPLCQSVAGPSSGTAASSHLQLATERILAPAQSNPFVPCTGLPSNTIDLTR